MTGPLYRSSQPDQPAFPSVGPAQLHRRAAPTQRPRSLRAAITLATTATHTPALHSQSPSATRVSNPLAEHTATCTRHHLAGDSYAMTELTRLVTPRLHHIVPTYRLPHD